MRIFGSNLKLDFVLCFFTLKAQVQFSQACELNQFLGFWFLFTKVSCVKLLFS